MRTIPDRPATTPETLLGRFRDTRDPAALGALFDATAPVLLRVALSIAPDAATAENALQETFLAVLEAPERWDPSRPVMPWLLGILHRQVGKARRDGARAPDPLRLPPPLGPDDPADSAASREEQARVRAAIDELPEPYRAVALLRWRHGLDPADIADVRGEPPGTTRSLLSRALTKLRERLGGGALALFGVPGTRGLDGIRRALMSRAAAVTAASGTTAAAVGGAIVMKKIVAAALAVLLLLGGTWWTASKNARSSAASKSHADVVASATAAAERKRKHAAEIEAAPKGELPPVDLDKCDRDLDLFGRVVDEEGKPVAGASVETLRYPWRVLGMGSAKWRETEAGRATRTAKDGTFAVRLARGDKVDLRVSAAPFGPIVRTDCQAGERVEVTLRHGATLDVTAVDEAGAPVPDVRLRTRRNVQGLVDVAQTCEGVTDAAGRVAIAGMLPGSIHIDYLHPTLGEPKWQRQIIPAKGTLTLRVTMRAGRTLRGRVTDADSGKPIARATIDTWNRLRPATTDADGRYAYAGWTYDRAMPVAFSADGYGEVYRYDLPDDGMVDVALRHGDRVVGTLVHADGTPVEGALVGVYGAAVRRSDPMRKEPSDSATARTAADGRFDLGGFSRDRPHKLIAYMPGLARTTLEFERHFWSGDVIDVGNVVMRPPRAIEGVATDAEGLPLPDATVILVEGDPDTSPPGGYLRRNLRRTDDLGRFRFPELSAGTYVLSVGAANAPLGPLATVELPADRDILDARVRLGGAQSLTVLVVDETGEPVSDALVGVDSGSTRSGEVMGSLAPGADGRAHFRGLTASPATVYVHHVDGRFIARVQSVAPAGQEVRVVSRREIEIRGVVRSEDGKPLQSSIQATLRGSAAEAGSGWSDETGEFTAKVPLGEVVDLWARGTVPDAHGSTFTGFEGRVTGVRGGAEGVEIVLRPVKVTYDRALSVVVLDSTGAPVPGVEIGVYERNPDKSWKVKSDADGRVRFEGLPSHLIVLNFAEGDTSPPQHALDIAPQHFSVTPNGQEVIAKWRAGAAIRGRVADANGRGVAEAYIQVTTPDGTYIDSRGGPDGRFTTYGLPGLPHQLRAQGYVDGTPSGGTLEKVLPGDAEVTITVAPRAK